MSRGHSTPFPNSLLEAEVGAVAVVLLSTAVVAYAVVAYAKAVVAYAKAVVANAKAVVAKAVVAKAVVGAAHILKRRTTETKRRKDVLYAVAV